MSLHGILTRWRRTRARLQWDREWGRDDFRPHWLTDSPRPFVLGGFDEGWLSPGMDVLEIGCGLGRTAAALASRGVRVVGIDVSRHAIRRARSAFPDQTGLSFRVVDVCAETPLGTRFDVILDTGCLHGIRPPLHDSYRCSILLWSRPGTRAVVAMHTADTSREVRRAQVESVFVPPFELLRCDETPSRHPDAKGRLNPVFHLVRRETANP